MNIDKVLGQRGVRSHPLHPPRSATEIALCIQDKEHLAYTDKRLHVVLTALMSTAQIL